MLSGAKHLTGHKAQAFTLLSSRCFAPLSMTGKMRKHDVWKKLSKAYPAYVEFQKNFD